MSWRLSLLVVPGLFIACGGPSPLVRMTKHNTLEVAWIELAPPPGRPPVLLMNMVHVAAPGFFEEVQARLDVAATVLMEGIVRSTPPESKPQRRIGGDLFDVATALRLVHQVDVLNSRDHWLEADMNEAEFREMAIGEPPGSGPSLRDFQKGVNFEVFRLRRRHPELDAATAEERVRTGAARLRFARLIMDSSHRRRHRPIIIQVRNRIALRALDALSDAGNVALCWGFAHGHDYLKLLRRRGYRVARKTWHTVFDY